MLTFVCPTVSELRFYGCWDVPYRDASLLTLYEFKCLLYHVEKSKINTMADKLMYYPNDDTQYYSFCKGNDWSLNLLKQTETHRNPSPQSCKANE